jgi:hypothetical protein
MQGKKVTEKELKKRARGKQPPSWSPEYHLWWVAKKKLARMELEKNRKDSNARSSQSNAGA